MGEWLASKVKEPVLSGHPVDMPGSKSTVLQSLRCFIFSLSSVQCSKILQSCCHCWTINLGSLVPASVLSIGYIVFTILVLLEQDWLDKDNARLVFLPLCPLQSARLVCSCHQCFQTLSHELWWELVYTGSLLLYISLASGRLRPGCSWSWLHWDHPDQAWIHKFLELSDSIWNTSHCIERIFKKKCFSPLHLLILPLVLTQQGEIVQLLSNIWMIWSENFFPGRRKYLKLKPFSETLDQHDLFALHNQTVSWCTSVVISTVSHLSTDFVPWS